MTSRKSNFVFFLSDFGTKDTYVSQVKAVIFSIYPRAKIIDITHNIRPQEILEASFVLKTSFVYFPPGSIFLIVVDPGVGTKRKIIFVQTRDYFFLAPDNGVLYETLKTQRIVRITEVKNRRYFLKHISSTFHARDIFAPVVGHFLVGKGLEDFGPEVKKIRRLEIPKPQVVENALKGLVVHIDHFGNIVTNIEKTLFLKFLRGRDFRAILNKKKIPSFRETYQNVREPFFITGSSGFIEISLSSGSASSYFNTDLYDEVVIKRL